MTYAELEAELYLLQVVPPDVCRASLYLNFLQNAKNFFINALPALLAPNYTFVRRAVRDPSLLNEFAAALDLYIAPAVDAALFANAGNHWTYRQFFDNTILNINYNANLVAFRAQYTVSTNALGLLYAHFTGNIQEACQRIIADRVDLTNFYTDQFGNGFNIQSLVKIKSTGSDYHKGGKQVLILTFNVQAMPGGSPVDKLLKVVYKPSDIEADCLIAGDHAAVNRVINNFMAASLFEIYNAALATYKATHPDFTGEPLPVYRFLPRSYLSTHVGGFPLPVRDAYGYIEYLDNDLAGTEVEIFGYYPYGESDYLIFSSQDETAIIRKFYRIEGALSALACTFSIHDIHVENLRVKKYLPYFIDLEISLNTATADIENTSLISTSGTNAIGGINGICLTAQDFHWVVVNANIPGQSRVDKAFETVYYQNRLWEWSGTTNKRNVRVNTPELFTGFADGMRILREAQLINPNNPNNPFIAWFARLNNVLVRYIPYATAWFKNTLIDPYYLNPDRATGQLTLQVILLYALTAEYGAYNPGNLPNYLVLTPTQSLLDVTNLDVPVYYYRIGMTEIINSSGGQVPIPATVDIATGPPPPPPAPPPTAPANTNVLRVNFFPGPPTAQIIDLGQVQILSGAGFDARKLALLISIGNGLGVAGTPGNPQLVIPIDTRLAIPVNA